jgi:4-hydroxy-3-methylbut-2-enyl diphosphate reductase
MPGQTRPSYETPEDVPADLPARRIGVVVQTTQPLSALEAVTSALLPHTAELRVYNTICSATAKRQTAAAELAAASTWWSS